MQQSFVFFNQQGGSQKINNTCNVVCVYLYFLLLVITYACKVHVYRENDNPTFTICAILKESLQLLSDV